MTIHTRLHFPFAMLGVLLVAGCAFGDRHVLLDYPPKESGGGVISTASAATPTVTNVKPLAVLQFVDLRPDRRVIGEVRNGWGMRTANVVAENDVAEWVIRAVTTEFEKAGYEVVQTAAAEAAAESSTLSGDILTVFCTAMFTYEAEVSFIARIKKNGEEVLNKRYTGKGSVGLNWAATATSYGESLSRALANAVDELVFDVNQLNI